MNIPAVSVILPVYNGEPHLEEALDSILSQTFSDFEFIIVDDASTDATSTILADYAQRDSRVRILINEANSKIAASLNKGLAEARAPLIARMDADDWAHPERIAKQYAFMQAHPDVTVCGTWLETYEAGDVWQWPCDDAGIRAHMLFNSAIAHPTAMFRKEPVMRLAGGYDVSQPPVEDYDLWVRLAAHAEVRFANLPEVLLRYRTYPENNRGEYCKKQRDLANSIRLASLARLGLVPTEQQMAWHLGLGGVGEAPAIKDLYGCWRWRSAILSQNALSRMYDHEVLRKVLSELCHGFILRLRGYRVLHTLCSKYAPRYILRWYRSVRQAWCR